MSPYILNCHYIESPQLPILKKCYRIIHNHTQLGSQSYISHLKKKHFQQHSAMFHGGLLLYLHTALARSHLAHKTLCDHIKRCYAFSLIKQKKKVLRMCIIPCKVRKLSGHYSTLVHQTRVQSLRNPDRSLSISFIVMHLQLKFQKEDSHPYSLRVCTTIGSF